MFKYRVISCPVLLALLAATVWWSKGAYLYFVLAPILVGLAVFEAGKLLARCGVANFSKTAGILSGLTIVLAGWSVSRSDNGYILLETIMVMLLLSVFAFLLLLLFAGDRKERIRQCSGTLGVLGLIGLPLVISASVYCMADAKAFLFFVVVTKAMDTGGYVAGLLTAKLPGGNHKIVPSISPKKSWEGFLGGIILAAAAAYWLNHYCEFDLSLPPLLVFAAILALGSFAGDLTESAIKRAAEAKDSNAIIPGMGGAFDVLDSFLYNGILYSIAMIMA